MNGDMPDNELYMPWTYNLKTTIEQDIRTHPESGETTVCAVCAVISVV
jgi:hypothetical protein